MLLVEIKDFSACVKTYSDFKKWWLYNMKFVRLLYHQKYHKLIGIEQNIFVEKLEEEDGATTFPIAEKQPKIIWNFSLDSVIVTG